MKTTQIIFIQCSQVHVTINRTTYLTHNFHINVTSLHVKQEQISSFITFIIRYFCRVFDTTF